MACIFLWSWNEFSSPGNSVSCQVTENPILLGQTFQLLERKLNLYTWKFMSFSGKNWEKMQAILASVRFQQLSNFYELDNIKIFYICFNVIYEFRHPHIGSKAVANLVETRAR